MKKIFLILNLCLFYNVKSVAQNENIFDYLMSATILIDLGTSTGSGLIITDSTGVYLITAKHVIINTTKEGNNIKCSLISSGGKYLSYPHNYATSIPNIYSIDFLSLYNDGKLKYSETRDIVVIKIGESFEKPFSHVLYSQFIHNENGKNSAIVPFLIENIAYLKDILLGDDAFIFGYPKSLGLENSPQYNFNKPLLRKGTIAGKDFQLSNIILDCPVYHGNSGGPAIILKSNVVLLIGIVTQFIPMVDVSQSSYGTQSIQYLNSGYSVIEPMDEILKLIKLF